MVREVPIVLVDNSHSTMSREFTRKMDASPDVNVAYQATSITEAKDIIGHGEAYGILYFPEDFEKTIGRMEQAHVSIYCDMSYMLTYKAIVQAATSVAGETGAELQKELLGNHTKREDEIATKPLEFDEVPIFNTTGGYGNFIIPAVVTLIIQQAMLLGVGMIAGTRREKRHKMENASSSLKTGSWYEALTRLTGQTSAYLMIFSVMLAWITLIVPKIFGFVSLVHSLDCYSPFHTFCHVYSSQYAQVPS